MLDSYLLSGYYKRFFIFFLIFIVIFSTSDMLSKSVGAVDFNIASKLFILMLPLMAQFAVPLASLLAVQLTVSSLFTNDEIINFIYFRKAQYSKILVTVLFSTSLLFFYSYDVFYLTPTNYKKAKYLMLNLANDFFKNLNTKELNSFNNKISIYIGGKNERYLKKVIILYKDNKNKFFEIFDGNSNLLIKAKSAFLDTKKDFELKDGEIFTVNNFNNLNSDKLKFKQLNIDLSKIINIPTLSLEKQYKFMTLNDLLNNMKNNKLFFLEFNKRIAQILWQFLLPIIALFLGLFLGKFKNSQIFNIISSGLLFLISHIAANSFNIVKNFNHVIIYSFFYLVPILFTLLVITMYKKIST